MLALTQNWSQFLVLAGAGVIGAIILGSGKALMELVRTRQTKDRADEEAERNLTSFFFDQPRDPRTGTPATTGWTTKVDRALSDLAKGLREVLDEVTEDRNGDHNLRGIVKRGAEAAGADLPPECKK